MFARLLALISAFCGCSYITQLKIRTACVKLNVEEVFDLCLDMEEENDHDCSSESEGRNILIDSDSKQSWIEDIG